MSLLSFLGIAFLVYLTVFACSMIMIDRFNQRRRDALDAAFDAAPETGLAEPRVLGRCQWCGRTVHTLPERNYDGARPVSTFMPRPNPTRVVMAHARCVREAEVIDHAI